MTKLLIASMGVVLGLQGLGQGLPIADARTRAERFYEAVNNRQWEIAAAYVDSRPIESLRWRLLSSTRSAAERSLTKDERAQSTHTSFSGDAWPRFFPGVADTVALRSLSPTLLVVEWLKGQDYREREWVVVEHSHCSDSLKARIGRALDQVRYHLVGVIAQGDTTAYAVHTIVGMQTSGDPADMRGPGSAVRLVLFDGSWLVEPSTSLLHDESSDPSAIFCPR